MKKHITSGWKILQPHQVILIIVNITVWQNPVTVLKQLTGKVPVQKNCLNANPDTVFQILIYCAPITPEV